MRILFTGGGTGGHLFPIIAIARQLKKIQPMEMFFLGPVGSYEEILEKEGIKTKVILAGKIRRYFSIYNLLDLFKMPFGFLQALWYLYIWMPDIIFSKGGYGSVSVVLIGWLFRIPILIHESDTIPGLANRLAGKLAKRIAISFSLTTKYFPEKKTALIGNPIRLAIIQNDKERASQLFQISSQKPVIFILGGSQGAQIINQIVSAVLPQVLEKYEIIHQAGPKHYQELVAQSLPSNYHVFSFLNEEQIAAAYLLADLVISRAGASSIFEIAACAKPSILIPLPGSAADHQRENAFAYAQAGAATVVEQANLTEHLFLNQISKILNNPELVQKMKTNAQNFAKVEAAQKLAQALIEMGR